MALAKWIPYLQEYEKKRMASKVCKTLSFTLLTASAANMVTGIIVHNNAEGQEIVGSGVGIFLLGVLGSIGSVVLLKTGYHYQQQAIRIQLEQTKVSMHLIEGNSGISQPAIAFKIPLP